MAKDRDAWTFAISVVAIGFIFELPALLSGNSNAGAFLLIISLVICLAISGVGYFLGQLISKKNARIRYLVMGGALTVVLSNNTILMFDLSEQSSYLIFFITFVLSVLMGWRIPMMDKNNINS
ncbi:MAG: putative membrane-bound spermidine synthase [Paraglaciecola sp.]